MSRKDDVISELTAKLDWYKDKFERTHRQLEFVRYDLTILKIDYERLEQDEREAKNALVHLAKLASLTEMREQYVKSKNKKEKIRHPQDLQTGLKQTEGK